MEDGVDQHQGDDQTGSYTEAGEVRVLSMELGDEEEDRKQGALGWTIRRWFNFMWRWVWWVEGTGKDKAQQLENLKKGAWKILLVFSFSSL